MSLPNINIPVFFTKLPSNNEKVAFQPFTVRTEKMMSIALQTKDEDTINEALKNVVRDCTMGKLDIDKMASFDFEWMFLQLRAKSKSERIDLNFRCTNLVETTKTVADPVPEDLAKLKKITEKSPCDQVNKLTMSTNDIHVKSSDPAHSKKVMLTDTIGIKFKYPTIDNIRDVTKAVIAGNVAAMYDHIFDYIDVVFEGDTIYDTFTREEFGTWIESLNAEQFAKIEKFFGGIPSLQADVKLQCSKCGHCEEVHLEGLANFLASS